MVTFLQSIASVQFEVETIYLVIAGENESPSECTPECDPSSPTPASWLLLTIWYSHVKKRRINLTGSPPRRPDTWLECPDAETSVSTRVGVRCPPTWYIVFACGYAWWRSSGPVNESHDLVGHRYVIVVSISLMCLCAVLCESWY